MTDICIAALNKRMSWICVPLSLALANMWAFVYGLEVIPEVHVEFI